MSILKRNFYIVGVDENNYQILLEVLDGDDWIDSIRHEGGFTQYLKKTDYICSISILDEYMFETKLKAAKISYEKFPLNKEYKDYIKSINLNDDYDRLKSSFLDEKNTILIAETEIGDAELYSDIAKTLLEGTVNKKDKMKLYIHSNEKCGHSTPHIHAAFGDDKNYSSISLIDLQIIESNHAYCKKDKMLIDFVEDNLQKARQEWNKCETLLKFDTQLLNGKTEYLSSTHK